MAYRPSLIRPPIRQNPRALVEARMQRQALVNALRSRLAALFAAVQEGAAASPPAQPFPTQAAAPPARPFPPQAAVPPPQPFAPRLAAPVYPSFDQGSARPVLPRDFMAPRTLPRGRGFVDY